MTQPKKTEPTPVVLTDSTLPTISAAGFSARVNAYVIGRTGRFVQRGTPPTSPGCAFGEADLWFLSLVAPRGSATSLRAIWANLVSRHPRTIWLEDASKPSGGGTGVLLGHHRRDLGALGWRPHFRWRQGVIGASRELHALLEPLELTCWDQELGQATERASEKRDAPEEGKPEEDTEQARESHPLFLLLARPEEQADPVRLAERHLLFLSTRIEWLPYYAPWASFLWERAQAEGEAELLYTFCFADTGQLPTISAAYLCRPNPLALYERLRAATRSGLFAQRPHPNGKER
jgi:hypothetical protein